MSIKLLNDNILAMQTNKYFLITNIDDKKYGLPVENIEKTILSVETIELPGLPEVFKGIINYQGNILPVINMRNLFNIPDREIQLGDIFVIAHTSKRLIALIVDSVDQIINYSDDELINKDDISGEITLIKGLFKNEGNIILICDLENFVSLEEAEKFEKAVKK